MLATKMLAEPHHRQPLEILNPSYRYYDYEFERYWHYYQVWGRVSYNPGTPPEVWESEFEKRFGREAGIHLMRGLHQASKILPRIVAASYRYRLFPTTRGWAEMTRMEDLPKYATDQEGSDIQQFMNVRDGARRILEGTDTAMRRPEDISRWFARASEQVLKQAHLAETAIGAVKGKEFVSTITDLKILAHLAGYHSRRLLAGLHYNLYKQSGDLFAFDDAIQYEKNAIQSWGRVVESAGDVYNHYLAFGVHDKGFPRHWREELEKLREGLKKLEADRSRAEAKTGAGGPLIAHVPVRRLRPHDRLRIRATVGSNAGIKSVRALIARNNGPYESVAMKTSEGGMYQVEITPCESDCQVKYFIEAVSNAREQSQYPANGKEDPVVVVVTSDDDPPAVKLERARGVQPGKDVKVTARVTDPSGIRWVRLRYRHATQFEDYETLDMRMDPATGLYEARIPGEFVVPKWDLMYFLEAMDGKGNGRMYPDLETDTPYVIVKLER
ncbi:MAG: hypothetical protein GY953_05595, partial [bacterium]|nr:hypothetical protein [bacterium]